MEKRGSGNDGQKGAASSQARLRIVLSMLIFGTIGLVRRSIPYSSAMIAFTRGAVATIILAVVHLISRRRFDRKAIMRNLAKLMISGELIGFNWILLFESYRYTSVSVSTVCYYMAPFFTILMSPFVLKEKINLQKGICAGVAIVGMVFVSKVIQEGVGSGSDNMTGVLLALGAAFIYACVVMINKRIDGVSGMDRTLFQMAPAALAVLPYWLLTDDLSAITFSAQTISLLAVAGVVNTALAYWLYFSAIADVKAQTAALLSYIDPMVAVMLSAFMLNESMDVLSIVGVVLVIGSSMLSEIDLESRKARTSGHVGAS